MASSGPATGRDATVSRIASAPEPNDATPFLPERRSLKALREAAAGCRARVMLVGEQPGDREDLRAVAQALRR